MQKYNHKKIEAKWQKYWAAEKTFLARDFSKKPKKYVLCEFPYPSGAGLHMGHLRPYVAGDVYARFNRMKGFETIFPIGWDAFGLPAENYAIKMGVHPSKTTAQNIKNAKKQMQSWGLSFDWSREINTTDPDYYKWTQWLFLQFYKAGLAYEATGLINWCPKDKTGLANEEVIDGKCERCGTVVEKKELRQWYLKITAYAEKLLEGLKDLPEWPSAVKLQQENWIGKSVGAEISFPIIADRYHQGRHSEGVQPTEESLKPNFLILHGYTGLPGKNFIPWLKKELENQGYKVQAPEMPNSGNPKEEDQVSYVLKNCKIDENTILVGHSLGAVVALKVLLKHAKAIRELVLIAPAIDPSFPGAVERPFWKNFKWDFNYNEIKQLVSIRKILSDLKETKRIKYLEFFAENLSAELITAQAEREHFCAEKEPVILSALLPSIKVFTTRPDTIFGATYMVVAPEHPVIKNLEYRIENIEEVKKYLEKAKEKSEMDRSSEGKEKTGVELKGIKAINPATKQEIPVWVADYVLWGYGTGAIMAVPAHDERDFEFAKKFGLEIKQVVSANLNQPSDSGLRRTTPSANAATPPLQGGEAPQLSASSAKVRSLSSLSEEEYPAKRGEVVEAVADYGILINSGEFTGLKSDEAIPKMAVAFGKATTQYKLRDWVFSRQRYWGEPIPVIHCPKCGIVPVPDKDLPVKLPSVKKYEPTGTGESPLAAVEKWLNVKCPVCKSPAKREANTMPNWAGSSWYWLRYTDPKNKKSFADLKKQKYWTPVDVYFGGMEHTTLHLLYSRFWNLFLYDQGLVTSREPYALRKPHGIILGPDGEKMSKSRGNVVNPQDIVASHGADTLRMFELFLGPHEDTIAWNSNSVVGVKRFLDRVWLWVDQVQGSRFKVQDSEKVRRALNKLIKKITEDVENFHFNTCVSAFMGFLNEIKDEEVSAESVKAFLKLLYPFAPHMSEELNQLISESANKRVSSLQLESWPEFDPAMIVDQTVEIVAQVNGKVKGKVTVPAGSDEKSVKELVVNLTAVKILLSGQQIKRVVFVKDRLINLVI
jgi:leucyl-tRNA synthetase